MCYNEFSNPSMQPDLLTPAQAAQLKGVSRTTIYSAIAEGRLPCVRVLGRLALEKADVLEWTPRKNAGRPRGIIVSDDTRKKMSESHKRRWAASRKKK